MPRKTLKKTAGICETQPITAEGFKSVLESCPDLEFLGAATSLVDGLEMVQDHAPDLVVVDKGFGMPQVLSWIADARVCSPRTALVVWGVAIPDPEALRLFEAGARGILGKTADPDTAVACLRAVADGVTWMDDSVFRRSSNNGRCQHSELTPRERQVTELVQQGLKNTEIASELGICAGTVKIHLKHIFEKTGVRGRHGLALHGLAANRAELFKTAEA